ncbi:MAG: Methyltransferase type 11, partial [uncultured Nocardioidaceae bacterium]
ARGRGLGRPRRPRRRVRHRVPPPPLRRDRPLGHRRRAAPAPAPARAAACRPAAGRHGPPGLRGVPSGPPGLGGRRPRTVGLLLRSGLRAGAHRARPGGTPRRRSVRRRQRRHDLHVRPVVPRGVPVGGPGRGRAVLVLARLDPGPAARRLALRQPGRPGGGGPHRARPPDRGRGAGRARGHDRRLRGQPLVPPLV